MRRDRKDDATWTTLPSEPRTEPAPGWPLPDQFVREAELWAIYWAKPQAVLWHRNGQALEVALHVRRIVQVEEIGSPTALGTLVRQQMDALLLTLPAMLAARVRIAADEVGEKRDEAKPVKRKSARDRLKVVNRGDGE